MARRDAGHAQVGLEVLQGPQFPQVRPFLWPSQLRSSGSGTSKNDQLIRVTSLLLFHVFRLRSSRPDTTSEQTPVGAVLHSTPRAAPDIFYYPGMLILLLWVSQPMLIG